MEKQQMSSDFRVAGRVTKANDELQTLYGFGSVTVTPDGEPVLDSQGDFLRTSVLEKAVIRWMESGAMSGEDHRGEADAHVVEAMVWTKDKMDVLGIPPGILPEGLWLGVHVPDRAAYERRRDSKQGFSIEGRARRVPVKGL